MNAQQIKAIINGLLGLKTLEYPFTLSTISSTEPGYVSPQYIKRPEYRVDSVPITHAMIVKNKISLSIVSKFRSVKNTYLVFVSKKHFY